MPPRTSSQAANAQPEQTAPAGDVFQKCRDYELVSSMRDAGVYNYYRGIASPQDPVVELGGRDVVMLGSNNYLGLANHPKVKEASRDAITAFGTGSAGSRLLNGTLTLHEELEERLAAFSGREAALTFATGFQVNLGVLSCLVGRRDIVYLDNLDHACIVDGARLSHGKIVKFKHNDMADLAAKLERTADGRGRFIVVDGVYSMEGDVCDLPGLVELAQRYEARLMVDDAHGIGVLGDHGRGTAEHFGLEDEVDLVMGTFSKSLATAGGYIAGDAYVIDYIKHHARAQIFSAAPTPPNAAAALAALEIVETEPERRTKLWDNVAYMQTELDRLGFDTGESNSPVIPIVVGDDWVAFSMVSRLEEEGVFANPVVTPAVPPGRAMVRTSYMATHERVHLDRCLEALEKVAKEFSVI